MTGTSGLRKKHLATLRAVFARPVAGTIRWADIQSLLVALGAEKEEREGSRIAIVWRGQLQVFHRPHPQPDTGKGAVASVRRWLRSQRSQAMTNLLDIDGHKAVVSYDPDTNLLRGEFVGLNGGADFYAESVSQLREEGARSLRTFLDLCAERGIEPCRHYSGRLNLRLDPETHERAAIVAAAHGVSLNALIEEALEQRLEDVA
jgi:predicted HicB family RNase H-like nuclease